MKTEQARCPLHPESALEAEVVKAEDRFWGVDGQFTYGACPECGTWVLDPRPVPAEIGPFYGGYYGAEELEHRRKALNAKKLPAALGVDWLRGLDAVKRLRKQGATLDANTRLLDAGCGLGGFAMAMGEQTGAQVRGLDFDPKCRDFCKDHGLEVDAGELEDMAYEDGAFDVVTSWHCLEHTYDPERELRELKRITSPGGWLLLEVPTLTLIARIFKGRWFYLQAPTHLYHLRPATLRGLLDKTGWETKQLTRPWLPSEFAGSLLFALGVKGFAPRLIFPKGLRARLIGILFGLLLLLDIPVTLLMALLGDAGVMRVVARKPELAP